MEAEKPKKSNKVHSSRNCSCFECTLKKQPVFVDLQKKETVVEGDIAQVKKEIDTLKTENEELRKTIEIQRVMIDRIAVQCGITFEVHNEPPPVYAVVGLKWY